MVAMTTCFPRDVAEEILVRLPVKSLLRFRCVCKSWYALIQSPDFITKHLRCSDPQSPDSSSSSSSPPPNIIRKQVLATEGSMFSLFFGENLDWREQPVFPYGHGLSIVGYCHGVVCVRIRSNKFLLWNPATRECKTLPQSSCIPRPGDTCLYHAGFGFDSKTSDHKVMRIVQSFSGDGSIDSSNKFELYSLKANSWKEIRVTGSPLPATVILHCAADNYVNGCLFWRGPVHCVPGYGAALLFDLANESFKVIGGPRAAGDFTKFNDSSMAFLQQPGRTIYELCVWVMDRVGEAGSCWVKHFSFSCSIPHLWLLSGGVFLSTGELIVQSVRGSAFRVVASCSPTTKKPQKLGLFPLLAFEGVCYRWSLVSYKESVVSLGGQTVRDFW